jgi:thiol-disulfide isomerase/thioredoxin
VNRALVWVFALLGLGLLAASVATRLGQAAGAEAPPGQDVLEPEPAEGALPALRLARAGGGELGLAELRGRWLLINFWATWCEPCLQELPHLAVLADGLKDLPVSLVLVSVDERWEDVSGLAAKLERAAGMDPEGGRPMQVAAGLLQGKLAGVLLLLDPEERASHALGTFKYPETWLVDPQGRLQLRFVGAKAWGATESIAYLRAEIGAPR